MVYLFLAEGFEEVEAITAIDFLRRAGVKVTTVSVGGIAARGAHGVLIEADTLSERLPLNDETQGVILPGGSLGTQNLKASEDVEKAVTFCYENNKIIAAICAAPTVLAGLGMLEGKKAACYPGLEGEMAGAEVVSDSVVVCDNIVTGRAAGVSWEFAAAIAQLLVGKEKTDAVSESIQWNKS